MKINWVAVLRDVLMVMVVGTAGTLAASAVARVVGDGLGHPDQYFVAVLCLAAGFTISGCLAGTGRFKHLVIVAAGVWSLRLILALVRQYEELRGVLAGSVVVLIAMLIGGVISLAIVPPKSAGRPPAS